MWYGKLDNKYYHIAVSGGHAYVINEKYKLDIGTLDDAKTTMFQFGDVLYLQNGINYYKFTGKELVDENEVNFNSSEYEGTYPKTLSLPSGAYRFKLGGGKGEDKTLKIGKTTYVGRGGKGGTINFRLNLASPSTVRIEKITNGSQTFRTSFHVYVNDELYAAVGGGGDANYYGQSTATGWLGGMNDGGDGGSTNADDGVPMGTPARGARVHWWIECTAIHPPCSNPSNGAGLQRQ